MLWTAVAHTAERPFWLPDLFLLKLGTCSKLDKLSNIQTAGHRKNFSQRFFCRIIHVWVKWCERWWQSGARYSVITVSCGPDWSRGEELWEGVVWKCPLCVYVQKHQDTRGYPAGWPPVPRVLSVSTQFIVTFQKKICFPRSKTIRCLTLSAEGLECLLITLVCCFSVFWVLSRLSYWPIYLKTYSENSGSPNLKI